MFSKSSVTPILYTKVAVTRRLNEALKCSLIINIDLLKFYNYALLTTNKLLLHKNEGTDIYFVLLWTNADIF